MNPEPHHRAMLFATPWPGVHGTQLDSARHFSRHWHSTHGIGVVDRGAQRSASGCGEVEAFEGDVIATNPGEVHDGRPLGGSARRWRMLYFEPGVLPGELLIRPVTRDPALGSALQRLFVCIDDWQSLKHTCMATGRANSSGCRTRRAHSPTYCTRTPPTRPVAGCSRLVAASARKHWRSAGAARRADHID